MNRIPPELSHRALAADVIRRAIARHDADEAFALEMARRFDAVSDRLAGIGDRNAEGRRWQEWLGLARHAECESNWHLIRAVLGAHDFPDVLSFYDAERRSFPPRALDDGSRIFVAYPNPEDDHVKPFDRHRDNRVIMRLVSLKTSDVASFDQHDEGPLSS